MGWYATDWKKIGSGMKLRRFTLGQRVRRQDILTITPNLTIKAPGNTHVPPNFIVWPAP